MALPGVCYWIMTTRLIGRRASSEPTPPRQSDETPPATFLRPVKRGVPGLYDKARRLVFSARSGDRVFFGVDSPEDFALCRAACAEAPEGVRASVLLCTPEEGITASLEPRNPKIEKLMLLSRDQQRGPEHWIITDSEALSDRRFMDAFRAEWAAMGKGVLTAGYRFTGAANFPQQFDHLSTLLTLWPGLAAAEWGTNRASKPGGRETAGEFQDSEGLGFALGACIAVRRDDVAAVGGWEAFSSTLAEDNRLGAALAEKGRPTRLSRQVLTLDADPIGWLDWVFHQHRVAFTYRICNPAGAFAMVFTHGVSWSFLPVLLQPMSLLWWSFFASIFTIRIVTARRNAQQLQFLVDAPVLSFAVSTLATSLAETIFWLLAWLPLPVRWGGRFLRVNAQGHLISAFRAAGEVPSALPNAASGPAVGFEGEDPV